MKVRRARLADAGRIAEIHVLGWQGGYQGLMPQDYLDGLDPGGQRFDLWAQSLAETDWSRGGTLVVEDQELRTVGFAHLRESRDDDADPAQIGEVWAIYLEPAAWGQGIGRELMTAALDSLGEIGYAQVTLWVLDTNIRARRFYEAAGFRLDGAVKFDDSRGFRLREVRYRKSLR